MRIPPIIQQGDTITWRDDSTVDGLGNPITSADWTLTWYFAGPSVFNVVSSIYETGWETSLTAAQTTAMTASETPNYYWQAVASFGAQKVTIGTGQVSVAASLSTASAGFDGRTQAEKDLEAVQAAIRARAAGNDVQEYWIGNRRMRYFDMGQLLVLESRLKMIVAKERQAQSIANGLGDPRNTFVRFG